MCERRRDLSLRSSGKWLLLYCDVLLVLVRGERYFSFRGDFGLVLGLSTSYSSLSGVARSR